MRKLLIPLLCALLLPNAVKANWFGKYNSRYDANEACEKWMFKGFEYTYKVMGKRSTSSRRFYGNEYDINGNTTSEYLKYLLEVEVDKNEIVEKTKSGFSRSCFEEEVTNQFIGREKSCLKKKEYSLAEWEKLFELKSCETRKYFKY